MMISKLHYISQGLDPQANLFTLKKACQAGCDLVQLRIKDQSAEEVLPIAQEARAICDEYGSKLIINDYITVAQKVKADGVHLGLEDMSTAEARKLLGSDFIIGGTANTLDDILMHVANGVDYVGVGPFRFTQTKKKLSPVLGLEGYQAIMRGLALHQVEIPVFAIGGIEMEDIEGIMQTGVHGIAVSGLVTYAENQTETVKSIHELLVHQHETQKITV